MTRRVVLLAVVVAGACVGHVSPSPARVDVLGRWLLSFHIMGGLYRTPVELSDSAGTLRAASLGPPLLRLSHASVDGATLQLEGSSRYGGVRIGARLTGDSLYGRWRIRILRGDVTGHRMAVPPSSPAQRRDALDSVWTLVARAFYDPSFGGTDWAAVRRRYHDEAARTGSEGELLDVMRRMLAELHSSHLDVSAITLAEAFPARGVAAGGASSISWRRLDSRTGYLRIAEFSEGAADLARVDTAFSQLAAYPSLIVDVRGNPGGTLGTAMRLGDHVLERPTLVGSFATRAGLAAAGARTMDELAHDTLRTFTGYAVDDFLAALHASGALAIETGGRVASPFRGRMVLLVDEKCGSTTEAFAAVLQELGRATLVGRRTAGAMLSAAEFRTIGGWVVRLPEADFRTPGGRRVEGAGVTPDVFASWHWYHDGQLSAARKVLGRSLSRPPNCRAGTIGCPEGT